MDEEQLAKLPQRYQAKLRRWQAFQDRYGPERALTCPYCDTEAVRQREWDDHGTFDWGAQVYLPVGKTISDLHGEIVSAHRRAVLAEWPSPADQYAWKTVSYVEEWYCENGHCWRMHITVVNAVGHLYDRWDSAAGPVSGFRSMLHLIAPPQRRADVVLTPLRIFRADRWVRITCGLELQMALTDARAVPRCAFTLRDNLGTTYAQYRGDASPLSSGSFTQEENAFYIARGLARLAPPVLIGTETDNVYRYEVQQAFTPAPPAGATTLFFELTALSFGTWQQNTDERHRVYTVHTTISGQWSFILPIPA